MPGSLTAPAAHPAHWLMVSFFIHKVRLYEREIEDRLFRFLRPLILLLRLIPGVSEITTWCRYSIPILVYLITWIRTVRLRFSVGSGLFRKLQITELFISRITFLMQRFLKTVIHNKRQLACMPMLFMVFYRLTNDVY